MTQQQTRFYPASVLHFVIADKPLLYEERKRNLHIKSFQKLKKRQPVSVHHTFHLRQKSKSNTMSGVVVDYLINHSQLLLLLGKNWFYNSIM